MSLATVLDLYSLEEILELNDVTPEEALEYLVQARIVRLPEPQELEFDD
jgi:hypothetical protein